MRTARSTSPNGSSRANLALVRGKALHARTTEAENATNSTLQVLHCVPIAAPRGMPLQFHSFDEAYLQRLAAGEFRTQEHFVAYFGALIQVKLRSRLHSPQAIEDVRQETFARFFASLRAGKIMQPERLGPFVNSICNNVLLEHYRAGSRNTSLEDEENDFPDKRIGPHGVLAEKQTQEKVREILEQLSERDRRLLREVFLEERDKDSVCRDFGVDRDYLRVLLCRAKKMFKAAYLENMGAGPSAGFSA
jgi:RNA polymerase sigma-70 factor (ECF subfamily)